MSKKFADEPLLSVRELAERLGVSTGWVYGRTAAGSRSGIPFVKLGTLCRFRWSDVSAWIESGKAAH